VAWNRILRASRSGLLAAVEIEALEANNVDDLVIHLSDGRSSYAQIRFAVDATTPLNQEYLTEIKAARGTSVFQKLYESFQQLGAEHHDLMLITNRSADVTDPVFALIDGRTELIAPGLAQARPHSAAGMARQALADHLGCTEEQLLQFLGNLHFRVGRTYQGELEAARDVMNAAGLMSDDASVRQGIDLVRRWVLEGRRRLDVADIDAEIAGLDLRTGEPGSVLIIQALLHDPAAIDADEALDWVDLFEGDSPAARRRTKDPDVYKMTMQPQLNAAAEHIIATGRGRILVLGAMRLPAAFAVGAALPKVRGVELSRRQGNQLWSTHAQPEGPVDLEIVGSGLDQGRDVAIVVGLTNNPHDDVVEYARFVGLPVREVLTLMPSNGPADDVVTSSGHAVAWATALRDAVREQLTPYRECKIHLFLACPGALAMILGHRWNRVLPTLTYEDVIGSYQPAFEVPG